MSPTTDEPFFGPKLKAERANCHISDLNETLAAFFQGHPYKLVAKPDAQCISFVIRVKKDIPHDLPTIIGDAVHNLRSALDLLACDLVRLNGGSTNSVYFPFADSGDDLEALIKKRKIDRASAEVVEIIRALKPYKGGNDMLRAIHD